MFISTTVLYTYYLMSTWLETHLDIIFIFTFSLEISIFLNREV